MSGSAVIEFVVVGFVVGSAVDCVNLSCHPLFPRFFLSPLALSNIHIKAASRWTLIKLTFLGSVSSSALYHFWALSAVAGTARVDLPNVLVEGLADIVTLGICFLGGG